MKTKILLLITALTSSCIAFAQQGQFNYYGIDTISSLYNPIIKIVDFQEKKYLLDESANITSLDTTSGIISLFAYQGYGINDIGLDSTGRLVLLLVDRLEFFDGQNWTIDIYPGTMPYFSNLVVDSTGNIYCRGDSLYRWQNGNWATVPLYLDSSEYFENIFPGPNHEAMYYTGNNVYSYHRIFEVRDTISFFIDSIPNPYFNYPQYDNSGNLWYADTTNIHKRFPSGNEFIFNTSNSPLVSQFYPNFLINPSGTDLWLENNFDDTLYHYYNTKWEAEYHSSSSYFKLMYQQNDELWADDFTAAYLYKFKGNYIREYRNIVSIQNDKPLCIKSAFIPYGQPIILIGTNRGILEINDPESYSNVSGPTLLDTSNTTLMSNHIYSLESEESIPYQTDTIYVGTDSGLFKAILEDSLEVIKRYTTANSLIPSDTITSLHYYYNPSGGGNLWIGTNRGCARLSASGTFTVYNTSNSVLPSNHVNRICVELGSGFGYNNYPDSIAYVCTDSGFAEINGTNMKAFTIHNSGLQCPDVRYVCDGNNFGRELYVGTMGGGMAYADSNGTWHYFNTNLGNFASDSINYLFDGYAPSQNGYYSSVIGTKDKGILFYLDYQFFNTSYSQIQEVQSNTIENVFDYDMPLYPCEGSGGWEFITLTDSGFVFDEVCFGGITKVADNTNSSIIGWFNSNELNVKWNELKPGAATLQLYDMTGRMVLNVSSAASNQIVSTLTNNLSSGIYIVRVEQLGNAQYTKVIYMK